MVPDERGWQGCGKEEKRGWRLQVVQVAAVPQDWGQSMRPPGKASRPFEGAARALSSPVAGNVEALGKKLSF